MKSVFDTYVFRKACDTKIFEDIGLGVFFRSKDKETNRFYINSDVINFLEKKFNTKYSALHNLAIDLDTLEYVSKKNAFEDVSKETINKELKLLIIKCMKSNNRKNINDIVRFN